MTKKGGKEAASTLATGKVAEQPSAATGVATLLGRTGSAVLGVVAAVAALALAGGIAVAARRGLFTR